VQVQALCFVPEGALAVDTERVTVGESIAGEGFADVEQNFGSHLILLEPSRQKSIMRRCAGAGLSGASGPFSQQRAPQTAGGAQHCRSAGYRDWPDSGRDEQAPGHA
jgi:hypothetical protein